MSYDRKAPITYGELMTECTPLWQRPKPLTPEQTRLIYRAGMEVSNLLNTIERLMLAQPEWGIGLMIAYRMVRYAASIIEEKARDGQES